MKWNQMFKGLLKPERRVTLIVLLGIGGMLLILSSYFMGGSSGTAMTAEVEERSADYAAELEQKLSALIGEIDGVGRSQVMVTLENNGEYVFAQEEKRNVDKTTDPSLSEALRITEKENTEQKYVLIDSGRQALIKTQLQPSIQGVVVICEGADDIYVQSRIVNVVTTALNVPSTRVCVEKIKIETTGRKQDT